MRYLGGSVTPDQVLVFELFFFDLIFSSDINECSNNNGGCSSNAVCTNTPGSFICACVTGYRGNGFFCSGGTLLLFVCSGVGAGGQRVQMPLGV